MNHAEAVLCAHLTEVKSLDVLAVEGFGSPISREVIPTQLIGKLVDWALTQYWRAGREVAPTRDAFLDVWGDEMADAEVEIDDDTETDSIEWAIEKLRCTFAEVEVQRFAKEITTEIYGADDPDKIQTALDGAHRFYEITQRLSSRRMESLTGSGFDDVLLRHEHRATTGFVTQGLTFGLPMIDNHVHGVHDGELCVLGAYSGVGKSWVSLVAALAAWESGVKVLLVTLENDLEMTFDRMACMSAGVDYERLQLGKCDEGAIQRVTLWRDKLAASPHQPIVTMLQDGERDAVSIVRRALSLGCRGLIIDQLSFMESMPGSYAREAHNQIAEVVRGLKVAISEGHEKIPCLLLHQVNRAGQEAAEKAGGYEQRHMAGSSEVERSADMLFVIYQSKDMRVAEQAEWQILKFRRGTPTKWLCWWRLGLGDIRVIREIVDEDDE